MRIVGQRVVDSSILSDGVAEHCGVCIRILHCLIQTVCGLCAFLHIQVTHHRLVCSLPVIGILALAPLFLESLLALIHGHLVVEVPLSVFGCWLLGVGCWLLIAVAHSSLLLLRFLYLCLQCFVAFLLFLLLECLNDAVDGCQTLLFWHIG